MNKKELTSDIESTFSFLVTALLFLVGLLAVSLTKSDSILMLIGQILAKGNVLFAVIIISYFLFKCFALQMKESSLWVLRALLIINIIALVAPIAYYSGGNSSVLAQLETVLSTLFIVFTPLLLLVPFIYELYLFVKKIIKKRI